MMCRSERRADRRRDHIQLQLLLGPAPLSDLARVLRRPRLLLWIDLGAMEAAGNIVTQWVPRPGWPDGAEVAAYRLPTPAETATRDAGQAAMGQRLREALRERATQFVPDREERT